MDNRVSVIKCGDYSEVDSAVEKAVAGIGGIESFIKEGAKVVIKPNLIAKKKPDEAVTTHPDFLRAVIKLVERAHPAEIIIAESPGGPYSESILKGLYTVCGMDRAVQGTSARLNFDTSFAEVSFPQGKIIKSFPIIKPILDADVVISLPKLKTHAMTSYTGAVKNLFGAIPGTYKAEYHFRLNDRKPFCSMLVDLHECIKPTLSIMDAVWGMEGDGPTAGQNRHIGLVLASANSHTLDMAACHIIDYKPHEVDTVSDAVSRGLCPVSADKLEVFGEDINSLVIKDFKKPKTHFDLLKLIPLPSAAHAKIVSILRAKPAVIKKRCIGCRRCMESCPPGAIEMRDGKPEFDMDICIRCFCCHELCPEKAIEIKRPLIMRAVLKIFK